ncbi:MAG: MarR family winged helix-turn-helix transcriptional regulator [Pseudochelatococcus sp.]|jgi:DNA-binding MarR family transcriptional regulator|uniref:MarR family winged helix-turn-helix transcriptional regulator n=1 Tax=Pseudochelatococcus sp. TaxID=2020869 RepID=UPI003D924864
MAFDLDGFLPYRLSVAAAQVSRRFAERYAVEAGLSMPEWRVLAHLNNSGPVSVRDINTRVNLDKSLVSRAATRLEQAGLLRKSSHETDHRLVALELTGAGQELMCRLGRIAEEYQAELVAELGEDAERFSRALTRLCAQSR